MARRSTPIVLPPVLLVAHNAGNQESTARRASKHDAAGMEIDVHLVDGALYAAHSAPSGLMPMRAWQAPRLRDAWQYSANAKVLKLDLKSTSQPTLDALVRFVDARPSDQQIMIVSSNPDVLAYLDTALPESLGLLSLSSGYRLPPRISFRPWTATPSAERSTRGPTTNRSADFARSAPTRVPHTTPSRPRSCGARSAHRSTGSMTHWTHTSL